MIKNLCFRPLSLENEDCRNISLNNIHIIKQAIKKRRWEIICNYHPKKDFDLVELSKIVKSMKDSNIISIGLEVDPENISEKILNQTLHNIFYTIHLSDLTILLKNNKDIFDKLFRNEIIFIENSQIGTYSSRDFAILKKYAKNNNNKILIESFYSEKIDDFSFGENIYLDYSKLKKMKLSNIDYKRYFISTSYFDTFNINQLSTLTGWEYFREDGIFESISFLRNNNLTEKEIMQCTYFKFKDLFDDKTK